MGADDHHQDGAPRTGGFSFTTYLAAVGVYGTLAIGVLTVGEGVRYLAAVLYVLFAAPAVFLLLVSRHKPGAMGLPAFLRRSATFYGLTGTAVAVVGGFWLAHVFVAAQARQGVQDAVEAAGVAEMRAYEELPRVNLGILKESFVEDGEAYLKIRRILDRHAIRGWIITNRGSTHERKILSFVVVEPLNVKGTRFLVRTRESWRLPWYDTGKQRYAHDYNEINNQTYVMVRQDDKWLVETNQYKTRGYRDPQAPTGFQ